MPDLMNYKTGVLIRTATPEEAAESAAAAETDGGRGAILVTLGGEPTICYVEGAAPPKPKVLGVLNHDWALERNDDDQSYFGGGELEPQHSAETLTDQKDREVLEVRCGAGGNNAMVNLGSGPEDLRLRDTHIVDAFARTFEKVTLLDLLEGDKFSFTPAGAVWVFLGGLSCRLETHAHIVAMAYHDTIIFKLV